MSVLKTLVNASGSAIENLNADWTSKSYEFGDNSLLCIHLGWSDASVEGTLYLEYSGDPINDGEGGGAEAEFWDVKNAIVLDGSFSSQMFLDSNLAISTFRLRFEHTSGTATLKSRIVRKRGY